MCYAPCDVQSYLDYDTQRGHVKHVVLEEICAFQPGALQLKNTQPDTAIPEQLNESDSTNSPQPI